MQIAQRIEFFLSFATQTENATEFYISALQKAFGEGY